MPFLCIFLAAFLCSCSGENPDNQENVVEGQNASTESVDSGREEMIPSVDDLFSGELLLEEEAWRDNTLDDYTAVMHLPLRPQQPEGELGGGRQIALGSSCGAVFKKHLLGSAADSWDELKIVACQGEENSVRLAFHKDTHNQAWGMGSIVGSDHFMMLDYIVSEDTGAQYHFFEIDEEQQIVRTIPVDFLVGDGHETPSSIMVDKSGNIHFTTGYMGSEPENDQNKARNYYMIANSDGALLAKYDYTGVTMRLVSLYDGRVALWSQPVDAEGRRTGSRLEYADAETGEVVLLAEFGKDAPKALWEENYCYYTLWDEKTLLYVDNRGLHFADLSGNVTGDAYIWSSHGIRFSQMEEIQIQEDGRINLIYSDYNREDNLLCLKPTQERVEIQEIVFAVAPYMRDVYYSSVVEFNKKYPAYHIEMKTDYDETALLTELIAGKGPVLIDTGITGFESHKKLWTPLEGLFAGGEWEDVLIPKAMELGEIDGTLYGVVSSFGLNTVVIAENEPTDWNYESFLDSIEGNPSIEAIYNGQNGAWSFMAAFLIHGAEDNYLLDVESGATYFDSDRFRRALRLAMTYCNENDRIESGTPLLEGKVFCNTINITRPELIDLYRICYGEDANYIGYPARNGSAHYIYGNDPLAIRATASDEEKRVAGAFLRMLLSQEGQLEGTKDSNFWLSVRRDVLEEQINQVNENSMPHTYGFDQIILGDDYDREYDARLLDELLEKAQPQKYFPRELNAILMKELEEYIAGTITEDVLIERLTKRVGLYLAEQH